MTLGAPVTTTDQDIGDSNPFGRASNYGAFSHLQDHRAPRLETVSPGIVCAGHGAWPQFARVFALLAEGDEGVQVWAVITITGR